MTDKKFNPFDVTTDTERLDWLDKQNIEDLENFIDIFLIGDIAFRQAIDLAMEEEK